MIRITTTSGPRAIVAFARPTSGALLVIRSVPGRQYNPVKRHWTIPLACVDDAVEDFSQMGFCVRVDGEIQTGHSVNPFPALRASMDPVTWRRVSRILAETLHPANGGDQRLHQLLKRNQRVDQEERAAS
jgi:hypothetical protein